MFGRIFKEIQKYSSRLPENLIGVGQMSIPDENIRGIKT